MIRIRLLRLSDNEKSYITTFSEYYEDYQNITCYSTKEATDDSYLVSVCYDLKFKGVDTPAPGMDFFYVERDGKGNLIINNIYSAYNFNFLDQDLDANLYSLILAYEKSDEVVALQKEVQTSYNEAVKSDEKLANMVGGTLRNAMAKWRETIVSNTETQTTTGSHLCHFPFGSPSRQTAELCSFPDTDTHSQTHPYRQH